MKITSNIRLLKKKVNINSVINITYLVSNCHWRLRKTEVTATMKYNNHFFTEQIYQLRPDVARNVKTRITDRDYLRKRET